MNMEQLTDYRTACEPKTYLDTYCKTYKGNEEEEGFQEFFLKACHKFWAKFQPRSSMVTDPADNIRFLDCTAGPVISNLISASPKVDHIVFAECVKANRAALISWVAGHPEAHDWSSFINFVVRDLEGANDVEAVKNREEELKRKIKSVVPCDVTRTPIVDLESVDVGKPFDFVSTGLYLEACVTSERQYKSCLAKICKFLKPNGYFFTYGVLEQTYFTLGKKKISTFPLTPTMVQEGMKEGEIEDVNFEMMETNYQGISNSRSIFAAHGKKSGKAELI